MVTILLVEDDEVDAMGIKRAFHKQRIANPLIVAQNGLEAFEFLRGENGRDQIKAPYLILLDLNMPRMNGLEFLEEVRRDPRLARSIIFVLTTSDDDRDKVASYEKHVAGYMVKSNAGIEFCNLIALLDGYWRYVEFPPEAFEALTGQMK